MLTRACIRRDVKKTLICDGEEACVLFSPDLTSSLMAVVNGTKKCIVFGTESFEVVQDICCVSSDLMSLAFDPTGTILVLGGRTQSLHSSSAGVVLVVRVGELLRLEWFCQGKRFADPALLCQKLSSLSSLERAQILFHRSIEGDGSDDHTKFPLEQNITRALATKQDKHDKASLGSSKMNSEPPFDTVVVCLRSLLSHFPQTVFAGAPGYGNVFGILLHERDSPRLLKLLFYVALKTCRSVPYLAMNEDMRNGTVTKALIASCGMYPEVVLDVVPSLVLWPASTYSSMDGAFRVPRSVYFVGYPNDLGQVSNDSVLKLKGHLMVSECERFTGLQLVFAHAPFAYLCRLGQWFFPSPTCHLFRSYLPLLQTVT